MASVILGIDQATHTGFAVIAESGEIIVSGTKTFSSKVGVRLCEFEQWFSDLLRTHMPIMVVYEKPHFRGYDSTVSCVGLVAEMLKCSAITGTPLHGVHSATLKSFATGYGRASKADMTTAANEATHSKLNAKENNDEADAIHLARYGWEVLSKEENKSKCRGKKRK